MKNKYIWFQGKKGHAFGPNMAKIIYKHFKYSSNKSEEIKMKIVSYLKIDKKLFEWIESFKDEYGEYFMHQIRNGIQSLKKGNFLIQENEKYYATSKLENFDISKAKIKVNNFLEEAKRLFKIKQLSKLEKSNLFQRQEQETISEMNHYQFDLKISKEKLAKDKTIIKLRQKFAKKIDIEKAITNNLFETYLNNDYLNFNYPLPERAHIIPVHILYKKKRWEDITNPFNGLFLDPNTHRLLDNNKIGFDNLYNFIDVKTKEIYASINQEILTPERKRFIDEHRKLFPIK